MKNSSGTKPAQSHSGSSASTQSHQQSHHQVNHQPQHQALKSEYRPFLNIDMTYQVGSNRCQTGKFRRSLTVKMVARFGLISPSLIEVFYGTSRRLALEHLNNLVAEGLLVDVRTPRSVDGRVYVLSFSGARMAEELMGIAIHYRSVSEPSQRINQNTVMHDLMCAFVIMRGLLNTRQEADFSPQWQRFISETEFRRLHPENSTRNIDGLVQEPSGTLAAIEMEHAFKTKKQRQTILKKWANGLESGLYQKVMLFSHNMDILSDIKRLHQQLLTEALSANAARRSSKADVLTQAEVERLQKAIIYRTVYCQELTALFYP
ncbi:hypothetical protein VXM60_01695 [Shewanella khirikhana]|uniref:hypothetical protein n=1 Tax=Shewanella khirikhana TaxID=1965282 RepID=UPI0030D3EE9E